MSAIDDSKRRGGNRGSGGHNRVPAGPPPGHPRPDDRLRPHTSLAAAAATMAERRGQVRIVQVTGPSAVTVAAGTLPLAGFVHSWRLRHTPEHAFSPDPNQNNPGPLDG